LPSLSLNKVTVKKCFFFYIFDIADITHDKFN